MEVLHPTKEFEMAETRVLLLPCQGDPVRTVWLPPSRALEDMVTLRQPGEHELVQSLTRRASELGLREGLVRILPWRESLPGGICWVRPNESPTGLVEVSVTEALTLPAVAPLVRFLLERQQRSHY